MYASVSMSPTDSTNSCSSARTRRRAWSLGRRQTYVVGSPWAYLLAMEPDDPQRREGTIWYPFHGWEGQHVKGDHKELIARIRDTEPGPVTVCLYWHEHRMRRVRRLYENAGFRVICHGYRGHWWKDTDPLFLDRQLAELRRHLTETLPTAMVPTPAPETSLTETSAFGLTIFRSKISCARSSIE